MTLIAGAYSRHPEYPIPRDLARSLQRNLSRHPDDSVLVHEDSRFFLATVDIRAFRNKTIQRDQQGNISALTGEPLLPMGRGTSPSDLEALHEAWLRNDLRVIRSAHGTFSGCNFTRDSFELRLFTDHLGVRPLYIWTSDAMIVFASALRVLESCPEIPRKMSARGVTERAAFGYPLNDRTPYEDIRRIGAAEIVHVRGRDLQRFRYWNWDEKMSLGEVNRKSLEGLYRRFKKAVVRRQRSDRHAVAFLSGGLDSRAVVSTLMNLGVRPHTFNFSIPGTQDQLFANMFASEIGANHTEIPRHAGHGGWTAMMSRAWSRSPPAVRKEVERPGIVWSGDGGSVVIGHVYLTNAIVDLLRAGRTAEAIALYARQHGIGVPKRILRRQVLAFVADTVEQGVVEELSRFDCEDPGKKFYLFLLENDQRRHLDRHFEALDVNRMEYQLPFFDPSVVQAALSFPLESCIHHRLYARWLDHFPPEVRAVPWQTYPGAVPCPIPHTDTLANQWQPEQVNVFEQEKRSELLKAARKALREGNYPRQVIRRSVIRIAYWLLRLRIRNTAHLLRSAEVYSRVYRHCNENGERH